MLHKETAEQIFRDYPEQQDIIIGNLLAQYRMDSKGENLENVRNEKRSNPEYTYVGVNMSRCDVVVSKE